MKQAMVTVRRIWMKIHRSSMKLEVKRSKAKVEPLNRSNREVEPTMKRKKRYLTNGKIQWKMIKKIFQILKWINQLLIQRLTDLR
jgi:hypothetical protein